jgi:predicted membrane channel-forming protein YqfA (hemolysin III family)
MHIHRPLSFIVGVLVSLWFIGNFLTELLFPLAFTTFYQVARSIILSGSLALGLAFAIFKVCQALEEDLPHKARNFLSLMWKCLFFTMAAALAFTSHLTMENIAFSLILATIVSMATMGGLISMTLAGIPRPVPEKTMSKVEEVFPKSRGI